MRFSVGAASEGQRHPPARLVEGHEVPITRVPGQKNAEPGVRESLSFKLKGTPSELATWGHEYVRHLSGEIAEEYNERLSDETGAKGKATDLMPLIVDHMVPFFIEHNAEAEAIDLLSEVGAIDSQRGMSLVALAAPLPATAARAPAWWLQRRSLPLVRAAEGGRELVCTRPAEGNGGGAQSLKGGDATRDEGWVGRSVE